MMRLLPILLLSLVLVIGCRPAAKHHEVEGTSSEDSHAMSSGNMENDMATMNDRMVRQLGPADSSYDDRFIDMMIPHHEGAVAMARNARDKAQHPELRALADSIIASQEREIRQMEEWRKEWYGH